MEVEGWWVGGCRGGGTVVRGRGGGGEESRKKRNVVFGSMLIGASRYTMLLEINWINYMARMCVAVNVLLTLASCM